jgi:N-acyl-D-amino-acid deacylase
MFDRVIVNGMVVDGSGLSRFRADVGIRGDRIAAIGRLADAPAGERLDATGCVVTPGFVDAHVHGDIPLLVDARHEPAIRQGVTTYIVGQDGVAMTPGSPEVREYMRRYTAGFSTGLPLPGPSERISDYLDLLTGRSPINAAVLVPNGNIRMQVMGLAERPATASELAAMERLVREAMEQGAVGLSSGLDYIPSRYADTHELIALCRQIAPFGGVYATHMRSYTPEGVQAALDEVFQIEQQAGCAVHIAHLNCLADQVVPLIDRARANGSEVTFDLYCYLFGSTILGMIALPAWVQAGGIDATLARLRQRSVRQQLAAWFAQPPLSLGSVRLGWVPSAPHYEGLTLEQAYRESRAANLGEFVCDLLLECELAVNCIVPHHPSRTEADLVALMRHPAMMGGSDGIFVGTRPHPRGCGCVARYLGYHVRAGHWTLEEAVQKLAYHPARRHGLRDRGLLAVGLAADVAVFDPATITDRATFDDGRALAEGMRHVLVNGVVVLRDGQRTPDTPGRGLRRWGDSG